MLTINSTTTTIRPRRDIPRRDIAGKSIREKAILLFPATEIKINDNGTATISSPVSGTDYTIDERGECSCRAWRACWHLEALKLYLAKSANVYATATNIPAFDSMPALIPANCHTISIRGELICPFCGNGRTDGWYALACDYCSAWAASTFTKETAK